jgi:hypothetical protein
MRCGNTDDGESAHSQATRLTSEGGQAVPSAGAGEAAARHSRVPESGHSEPGSERKGRTSGMSTIIFRLYMHHREDC